MRTIASTIILLILTLFNLICYSLQLNIMIARPAKPRYAARTARACTQKVNQGVSACCTLKRRAGRQLLWQWQ